jgi:hypothetical protein
VSPTWRAFERTFAEQARWLLAAWVRATSRERRWGMSPGTAPVGVHITGPVNEGETAITPSDCEQEDEPEEEWLASRSCNSARGLGFASALPRRRVCCRLLAWQVKRGFHPWSPAASADIHPAPEVILFLSSAVC